MFMSNSDRDRGKHDWSAEELKGEVRVWKLATFLMNEGREHGKVLTAVVNDSYNHQGVDIELYEFVNGVDVLRSVYEVTNYTFPHTKTCPREFRRYVRNLKKYDSRRPKVEKCIVLSFESNLYHVNYETLKANGIEWKIIGHTDTPSQKDKK